MVETPKEIESDEDARRYVVRLIFNPAIKNLFSKWKGECLKENVAKFLQGELISLVFH